MLTVRGTFAECVLLETLALSILNHDSAIASAAARMVSAADGRPIIEMGSRRTHEQAAVAAARAAYIAGFAGSSNLAAQRRYGVPALGTSAHAFTLLHTSCATVRAMSLSGDGRRLERAAFRAQVDALGVNTTLLVDTYDITAGVANAVAVAGKGWAGSGSTPAIFACWPAKFAASSTISAPRHTRIVVSGDLDEFAIAALRAEPVDSYGVGTSVVTGSGAPTAQHGVQAGRGRRHARGETQQPTRNLTAATSTRCGWRGRREPSSRRSSTPPARRPRTNEPAGRSPCRWFATVSPLSTTTSRPRARGWPQD